jgi:hypothetical protein
LGADGSTTGLCVTSPAFPDTQKEKRKSDNPLQNIASPTPNDLPHLSQTSLRQSLEWT